MWGLPALAAAALVLVLSTPNGIPGAPGAALEHLKGTGNSVLTVYRQGKAGTEKLTSRSLIRPGDVLQAAYQVSQPLQGALLSVDGGGNVTVHLAREGRSVALVPGGEHFLEFSYELDRAPRFEVLFLVTSTASFDLEPVRQILKQKPWDSLKPGVFGAGLQFTVLALDKELSQ